MTINEIGTVISVSGEMALVKVEEGENCSSCSSRSACRRDEPSSNQRTVEAKNSIGVQSGQRVQISIDGANLVKASFLMFVIPLIFLLAGAILGKYLDRVFMGNISELLSVLSGLGFMGLAFLGIKAYNDRVKKRKVYYPNIVKIF